MEERTLGQVVFEEYARLVDWEAYDGSKIPEWKKLSPWIRRAWEGAAKHGVQHERIERMAEVFDLRAVTEEFYD